MHSCLRTFALAVSAAWKLPAPHITAWLHPLTLGSAQHHVFKKVFPGYSVWDHSLYSPLPYLPFSLVLTNVFFCPSPPLDEGLKNWRSVSLVHYHLSGAWHVLYTQPMFNVMIWMSVFLQYSYVEILIPTVMMLGGRVFRRWLDHERRVLMNGICGTWELYLPLFLPCEDTIRILL